MRRRMNRQLLAARDWRIFPANGLDMEIILMNSALVPPALVQGDIDYQAGVGPASVNITWSTNLADSVLESISSLSTPGWGAVTNVPTIAGDQFSVTLDPNGSSRFFRLRKL